MVGRIKMKLDTQVGLGPGHTVLDGDSGPLRHRGTATPPPIFGPYLLWRNGSIDQDATWHGGRPRPRRHCVRWGPSSPPQKGAEPPPIFCPCLLWPNGYMDQDATWLADGVVVSIIRRMNEVTLPRARLVLGWVTVFGLPSRCVKGQLSLASLRGR